jgi:hypothetical protein
MAKKKTRKRIASRKRTTRRRATYRRTGASLSSASWAEIQGELRRREEAVAKLDKQRMQLLADLEAIEEEIADLGGGAAKPKRGRPRKVGRRPGRKPGRRPGRKPGRKPGRRPGRKVAGRPAPRRGRGGKMSLVEALSNVLSGSTMSVTEAAAAVKKIGYQTKSENFRTIVNQTLIKYPKLYKKIARGQYTAA